MGHSVKVWGCDCPGAQGQILAILSSEEGNCYWVAQKVALLRLIVTAFSPGQAEVSYTCLSSNRLRRKWISWSATSPAFTISAEVSFWFRCGEARKPQCPQTFPFVGSPPKLHPLPAATPQSGKEGLKSISLRPAQLALRKTSFCFFFFPPSLAEPVSSECCWPSLTSQTSFMF